MLIALPGIAAAAMIVGCGAEQANSQGRSNQAAPQAAKPTYDADKAAKTANLTITVTPYEGAKRKVWTLKCDPPGGTHPKAKDACAQLTKLAGRHDNPFVLPKPNLSCNSSVAGPEKATVTGTWKGKKVNSSYKRDRLCEEGRWSELGALFGPVMLIG